MPIDSLVAIAVKTGLLLAVVAAACRVLEHRSAACRHLLWTVALLMSLVLPIAIAVLPSYLAVTLPWRGPGPELPSGFPSAGPISRMPLTCVITGIWLCGAMLLLVREACAAAGIRHRVRQASHSLSLGWMVSWSRVSRDHRIDRNLRILESSLVRSPCICGVLRPILLLPECGIDWSESRRQQALTHELAHLRRLDHLSSAMARLACVVHWYNPLVWQAARHMKLLQEQACDDAVLRSGGAPSEYAQFLLDLARHSLSDTGVPVTVIGMSRRSLLHERVIAILDSRRTRPDVKTLEGWMICLIMCGLALLLATSITVGAHEALQAPGVLEPPASPRCDTGGSRTPCGRGFARGGATPGDSRHTCRSRTAAGTGGGPDTATATVPRCDLPSGRPRTRGTGSARRHRRAVGSGTGHRHRRDRG